MVPRPLPLPLPLAALQSTSLFKINRRGTGGGVVRPRASAAFSAGRGRGAPPAGSALSFRFSSSLLQVVLVLVFFCPGGFLRSASFTPPLVLGLELFLWRPGGRRRSGGRGARRKDDLVLPLPVSDDGAQQQGDDSHEVEVPLGAQKLVQVHLSHQLLHLAGVARGCVGWGGGGDRGVNRVWMDMNTSQCCCTA